METVTLKNGAEEALPLVNVTMFGLRNLMTEKPIVLYELAQLCRNPKHQPWGQTGEDLLALSLVGKANDGWQVHDSIRNIVLSAVEGDGLELTLGNPIAAPPELTEPEARKDGDQ